MPGFIARLLPLLAALVLLWGGWWLLSTITREPAGSIRQTRMTFLAVVLVAIAVVIISKLLGF